MLVRIREMLYNVTNESSFRRVPKTQRLKTWTLYGHGNKKESLHLSRSRD